MAERKRKRSPRNRTGMTDRDFWAKFDRTTRELLERIEYHRRKAAEEKAARGENAA